MDFTIEMALVDYIPVLFFTLAGITLICDLKNKMNSLVFTLFIIGIADIAIAGAGKATWKLIYAASQVNIEFLNEIFFPTQSMGFLFAGLALVLMLVMKTNKGETRHYSVVGYIVTMVAGLAFIDTVLSIIAVKLKKPALIAFFVVSFICSMGMGYISSQDFTEAVWNWIAEGINIVGQGTLLIGVLSMRKNGLKELKI